MSDNSEALSSNHCCHRKAIIMTYYVCVCVCVSVALIIRNTMRMCRIILSSVACMSLPGFSEISLKRQDIR